MTTGYGPFHNISFSLAAYNSDPRNYPDSSDFLEVFKDLRGREGGGVPRGSSRTLGHPPWGSLSAWKVLENLEKVAGIWVASRARIISCERKAYNMEWTVPCSHYYLRSLSWTSRIFHFPDSRDLLEVLRDFLGRERGGVPRGSSRTLGDPPHFSSVDPGSYDLSRAAASSRESTFTL